MRVTRGRLARSPPAASAPSVSAGGPGTAGELAEGAPARDTRELVRRLGDATAALCTHGDVVPDLLDLLAAEDGLHLPPDYPYAKGSTWVLTDEGGDLVARYLPPPLD